MLLGQLKAGHGQFQLLYFFGGTWSDEAIGDDAAVLSPVKPNQQQIYAQNYQERLPNVRLKICKLQRTPDGTDPLAKDVSHKAQHVGEDGQIELLLVRVQKRFGAVVNGRGCCRWRNLLLRRGQRRRRRNGTARKQLQLAQVIRQQ